MKEALRAQLLVELKDGTPERKQASIKRLVRDTRAEVTDALCAALADKSWRVRRDAARALQIRQAPSAWEPLLRALQDRYASVRREAMRSLAQFGRIEALQPIIQCLAARGTPAHFRLAASIMVRLGSGSVVEAAKLLSQPPDRVDATARYLLLLVVTPLSPWRREGRMRKSDAVAAELEGASLSPFQRWAALTVLFELGDAPTARAQAAFRRIIEGYTAVEPETSPKYQHAREVLEFMTLVRGTNGGAETCAAELVRASDDDLTGQSDLSGSPQIADPTKYGTLWQRLRARLGL